MSLICLHRLFIGRRFRKLYVFIFFASFANNGYSQCPVIPKPVVYQEVDGTFSIGSSLSINPENLPEEIKQYAVDKFTNNYGIRVVLSSADKNIAFKKFNNTPEDFYSINIAEKIIINYSSERSCFYAITTLLQLIQGDKDNYYLKKCFIQDYPKFKWRGLHLDVSRHFFSVDEVKRFLDLMALYKFNVFHWHLTDDQGWRIEIKKYPKLTGIGAWRDSTLNNHFTTNPRTYNVQRYGGYYTQEEIRNIVEYARKRCITVVPEIEMPGHSRAALAAYPEFSCTGDQLEVPGLWGVFDNIFCSHENSILFLKDILDEVMDLFPSEYIHIGGDEAPKTRWKKCKKCQAVIRENGLKNEEELQSYFIGEIDEYLNSKGRKIIGWDEILEGGLTPNAAVMSWRGFSGGEEAAKQHHFVVMSPGSHCYFDHYQSKNVNEPLAIGGYTPLQKVYEFNPVPPGLSAEETFYILGGQANLWTEYIPDMAKLEYMTYPRALALSQALWCEKKPAFEDFESTFINNQIPFLQKFNVNFSRAYFYPEMLVKRDNAGLKVHFKSSIDNYHFDLFSQSSESFPAFSGGQVVGMTDTLLFERTNNQEIINYTFKLSSEFDINSSVFKFKTHPSIGLPLELITQPNPRYNGNGSLTLVDGISGALPWKGHEWLGFDTSEIKFEVDLFENKSISSVTIGFLSDTASWIYPPKSIEIFVLKKNDKWKKLKVQSIVFSDRELKAGLKGKGRKIKFILKNDTLIPEGLPGEGNVPWTFLDEVIITYLP